MAPTVQRVLDVARTQLGYAEPGWGDDHSGDQVTKYGRWYAEWAKRSAYVDTYWCAMFASWCLSVAGFTPAQAGRYGNCNPWIAWFKVHRMWTAGNPKPGDVVFFSWDGDKWAEHVGFVEEVRPDGRLQTLEGNATVPGRRDGVYRMVRARNTSIVGYGRPPYAPPTAPAPTGGSRAGYPTLVLGSGGPEDTTGNQRWWVAQWLRLMAVHSPGYYKMIASSASGRAEIDRLEIGPTTLKVSRAMAATALGSKLVWRGGITPQLWAIYPPVS